MQLQKKRGCEIEKKTEILNKGSGLKNVKKSTGNIIAP